MTDPLSVSDSARVSVWGGDDPGSGEEVEDAPARSRPKLSPVRGHHRGGLCVRPGGQDSAGERSDTDQNGNPTNHVYDDADHHASGTAAGAHPTTYAHVPQSHL